MEISGFPSESKNRDSKKLEAALSDETITYFDFAIRLKRSYDIILKIQDNQKRKKKRNRSTNARTLGRFVSAHAQRSRELSEG